jgi:hypothetical protein
VRKGILGYQQEIGDEDIPVHSLSGGTAMEKMIKAALKSLEARNLKAHFAENCKEARSLMLKLVPAHATVGVGDSSTIRQIGIIKSLEKRGTKVINPFDPEKRVKDHETYFNLLFRPTIEATLCDVFLSGTNVMTQDGRLLNIDAAGNRVAGMFWGHPKSVIVVGRNKIVKNLEEAFHRIKNVTVPEHFKRRGVRAPCAITGKCQDCIGKVRRCAVTTIIESKPLLTDVNVVIVNEDLGLGWDESWPEKRIQRIAMRHEKSKWTVPKEVVEAIDHKAMWETVLLKFRLSVNGKGPGEVRGRD